MVYSHTKTYKGYIMLNTIPKVDNNEIFKYIKGYTEKYAISNYGNVYTFKRNKFMKPTVYKDLRINNTKATSYLRVKLRNPGTNGKLFPIHRLVALHFIDNTENKLTVNHKDGNGLNNHVSNLEWMTVQENIQHSIKNGWHSICSIEKQKEYLAKGNKSQSLNGRKYRLSLVGTNFVGSTLVSIEFLDDTSVKLKSAIIKCNCCEKERTITNSTFQTYIIDRKIINYCHTCASKRNKI